MPATILLFLRIAMTAVLYLFLFWILLTLWRSLQEQTLALTSQRVPPLSLRLTSDPLNGHFHFNRPQITLGRNPTCDCVLNDETISAFHARLMFRHNQWWVEDLRSTNGTFINGQQVASPVVITSHDNLRIGQINFAIIIEE
jgi:pSer/pThr/pTyr-binding forkhead associated (FHA) protein